MKTPYEKLGELMGFDPRTLETSCRELGIKVIDRELERGDGRKSHYGDGEQPWDTALRLGIAPEGAGFCILRYLRRTKDPAHSAESAKVYDRWLTGLSEYPNVLSGWPSSRVMPSDCPADMPHRARRIGQAIRRELTTEEKERLA